MPFVKLLTTLTVQTMRRFSRMRASSVLSIYLIFAIFIVVVIYQTIATLILYPLAILHFKLTTRVWSGDVKRSIWDPTGASTFIIGATPANRSNELAVRRRHVNYAALPMRRPEVDLMLSYLRPTDVYLEYGASGTTLSFPHLVRQSYSIEHDSHVCEGISHELLAHKELSSKLRAFCASVPQGRDGWAHTSPFEEGSYRAFHNYVDFPRLNLSDVHFDRVLINGRARVACALRILPQLHPSSLIFFHDFFLRPAHYSVILQYYDEVSRVMAHVIPDGYTDEPMGLVVLRPKFDYVVADAPDIPIARINAIYDSYDEKAPSLSTTGASVAMDHGLLRSDEGGFPYNEMRQSLSRQTSRTRLLLDVICIPFVILTYFALDLLFRRVFLEAIASKPQPAAALPTSSRSSTSITHDSNLGPQKRSSLIASSNSKILTAQSYPASGTSKVE